MTAPGIAKIVLGITVVIFTSGCAAPQRNFEQLPIAPMLGHPYHSTHGFEPRWGDPLSAQTF